MNLAGALGASALVVALAAALFALGASTWGVRRRHPGATAAGRRALYATAALLTVAMATLASALLRDDFSLVYVASVSSRDMETAFKWAAFYSGQPGSLLLWTWLLSLSLAGVARHLASALPWARGHAQAVGGALLAAFLGPLVFLASPFDVAAVTPPDGVGLNPLLVDRAMLIHPPMLLAGLTSTVAPFAIGAGALLAGHVDSGWVRAARPWALGSFVVLATGNVLGGWWAYTVLGWGGYWAWDPVENSAILPLLPTIALLHGFAVQERRGMLRLWNLAMAASAFSLAVFGTFNVRSGLVSSVHSFAQSEIGPYFLGVLAVVILGSIALLAWRSPRLSGPHDFESLLSRETGLIVNNYLLTAIALVILGGTLFPVASELARGVRVTVSEPFYNQVVGPLLAVLLLVAAGGMLLPWRRGSPRSLRRRLTAPGGVLIGCAAVLWSAGVRDPFALGGIVCAATLASVTLREYWLGARGAHRAAGGGGASWPLAVAALFRRDPRRYGGYLVHLGAAVMAVAVVGSTAYQQQVRVAVAPGESFDAGRYTLTYERLEGRAGTANGVETDAVATVTVREGDRFLGEMQPGRRFFTNFPDQPMGMVAVRSTWREDLYLFIQGWDENLVAEFQAFVNPLVIWLWTGAGLLVAGGLLAFGWQSPRPREAVPGAAGRA